ncbi:MAG: tetratricopeptide repeat-containing serine/threonine-protein kinase, partial [Gemmataceae bacterium]|nr:tetratricopeptide repeat-containing serine/threonine-protein kinase [Gemmataceae bacterium]
TGQGELVGTLKYMPPERFQGASDARGDVYSLGITLYELLARRPAFPDTTPQNLIQRITHGEPPRLRTLVPDIPRDLETILLKAIARDPAHRYQTAGDLADDLRRFLDDRPIRARRTTVLESLWRWCRRNRLVASLAAAAATLLVLVTVVWVVAYLRTAAANREMTKALLAEQEQREHAEATSALALKALDRIYDRFAPNRIVVASALPVEGEDEEPIEIPIQPVLSREAAPLLEELLGFYERLVEQSSDYAKLRSRAAEANHRIGDVRQRLGQLEQAAAAYQRAIRLYQQLHEGAPNQAAVRVRLARSYNELGRVYRALQQRAQEQEAHAQALAFLKEAPQNQENPPASRYELARTYYFLARQDIGPTEPGPGPRPGPGPGGAGEPGARRGPGRGGPDRRGEPGPRLPAEGQPIQEALRLLTELVREYPTVPEYRHLLACCYRDVPPGPPGRPAKLVGAFPEKAAEILQQLANDFPNVPDYRYDLSETYAKVDARLAPDRIPVAKQRLEKALAISRKLVADYPNVFHYAASHAQIHHKLGIVLQRMKQHTEAERMLREAESLQATLVQRYPESSWNNLSLAFIQSSLARVLSERKRWMEARTLLEAAIDRLEVLHEAGPPRYGPGPLGLIYHDLAHVLTQLGEKELAAFAFRKAEEHRPERPPGPSGSRGRGGERR